MASKRESGYVALMYGPDQPGFVHKIGAWIHEKGGNVTHAEQHLDEEDNIFFQRIEWVPCDANAATDGPFEADFTNHAQSIGLEAKVYRRNMRPKVAIFVSKFDHCFHDLILRWKAGEFDGDIVAIISNHKDLEPVTNLYGLPFHYVHVKDRKEQAETEQLELLARYGVALVVMARYMQVLSDYFISSFPGSIINIHHSFLPAFAGGRPYHQAHARGVKLIGATAHYATAVLDEGPIIQQDVMRVTHRDSVPDMVRKGRDLEKVVLAQAVRWHLQRRVLPYKNKTVVFD
jgi:formyltetrahydrofolate deformylase